MTLRPAVSGGLLLLISGQADIASIRLSPYGFAPRRFRRFAKKSNQNHVRHLTCLVIPVGADGIWQQVPLTGGHNSVPSSFCIFPPPPS